MGWRYRSYDLVTGGLLAELDVQDWSSTDKLSDAGSFSAAVSLAETSPASVLSGEVLTTDELDVLTTDEGEALYADPAAVDVPAVRKTTVKTATTSAKSLIVADRDGVPEFAGIPWRHKYDADSRLLHLAGTGLLGYWDHFKLGVDYSPSAVDQLTIFGALADDVLVTDIGKISHGETSGVSRDRTYLRLAPKKIGELLRELSNVLDGFDFDVRVEYSGDSVERHHRLYYPRRGRVATESQVQFRAPGNCSFVGAEGDATQIVGSLTVAGDGIEVTVTNTDLQAAGYPAYSSFLSRPDISSLTTLTETAQGVLRDRSVIDAELIRIRVDPDTVGQPYGSWELGDDCSVIIEDDPYYPAHDDGSPGLATTRRIVSHQWDVSPAGEQLTVALDAVGRKRPLSSFDTTDLAVLDARVRALEGY